MIHKPIPSQFNSMEFNHVIIFTYLMNFPLTKEQSRIFTEFRKSLSAVQYIKMSTDPLTRLSAIRMLKNLRLQQIQQLILNLQTQKQKGQGEIPTYLFESHIMFCEDQMKFCSDPKERKLYLLQKKRRNEVKSLVQSNKDQLPKTQQSLGENQESSRKEQVQGYSFFKKMLTQAFNLINSVNIRPIRLNFQRDQQRMTLKDK